MTILELLQSDGLTLKRSASTNGGEYTGPCPVCGGNDRFRCWPFEGESGGRYWCRKCNLHGDAIQYLREFRKVSFRFACQTLGLEAKLIHGPRRSVYDIKLKKEICEPARSQKPGTLWQKKVKALVEFAEKNLAENLQAQKYLFERGLKKETITTARLGWNPKTLYRDRKAWGLPEKLNHKGKKIKLWVPDGHVIPYIVNDEILKAKVRIWNRQRTEQTYCQLSGSQMTPMLLGTGKTFVVVESELDALLIDQEAGDLITAVAMGSAINKPDRSTVDIFKSAPVILIALDTNDQAGYNGWRFWNKQYRQALRWPVPKGKDPAEAWQQGLNIRAWIQAGIDNETSPDASQKDETNTVHVQGREIFKEADTGQVAKPDIQSAPAQCRGCWANDNQGCCCEKTNSEPCSAAVNSCSYNGHVS